MPSKIRKIKAPGEADLIQNGEVRRPNGKAVLRGVGSGERSAAWPIGWKGTHPGGRHGDLPGRRRLAVCPGGAACLHRIWAAAARTGSGSQRASLARGQPVCAIRERYGSACESIADSQKRTKTRGHYAQGRNV